MTNEIKEILDDLDYCKSIKSGNILLKSNECDDLLDYITNLQQRINKAIKKIEKDAELIDLEDGYNTCMAVIDILRGDE